MQPINVAIVGLGRIGLELGLGVPGLITNYATAVQQSHRLELLVGVDSSASQRDLLGTICGKPALESLQQVVDQGFSPDLFIVCTSTPHLAAITNEILTQFPQTRVLVEKPVTHSSRAISLCRAWPGARVRVGYTRAYLQSTIRMGEIARGGRLGALREVEGSYSRGFANNCSHLLDLMGRTFGQVRIDSWASQSGWRPPGDMSVYVEGEILRSASLSPAKFVLSDVDDRETTVASLTARFEFGEIHYLDQGARIEVKSATSDSECIITDMTTAIGEVVHQLTSWSLGEASLGCTLDEALVTSRLLSEVMES